MNDESSTLSIESLRKVDSVCTQFEAAAPGDRVPLSAWLDRVDPHERDDLRRELVAIEAELRQRHGDTPESSRYRFDFPIGRGGIGTAWRVFDNRDQRPLAMKRLQKRIQDHSGLRLRFQQEALLMGRLQHPGVPPVFDHGVLENGEPFFTMKWVQGDTLHKLLTRDDANAMSLSEKIGVFEQVAQTIAYSHSLGIVHRDLKPQNIMVGQFGEVQVIDWGLAKRLDPPSKKDAFAMELNLMADAIDQPTLFDTFAESDQLTSHGDVMGTPQYMAPEQARGELDSIRPTCDVFSLGAILFQMLTGERLYESGPSAEPLKRSAEATFANASERLEQHQAPSELKDLCRQCLQPNPDDRLPDASHIADAIVGYQNNVQEKLRDTELSLARDRVRHTEQRKRQRLFIAMASAIALIAATAAIVVGWQSRRVSESARQVLAANEKFKREAETSRDASEYLQSILSSPLPEKNYKDVTLREVIEQSLPRLEGRFADKPEVEGEIRRTLGETYRWLGRIDEAEKQHRLALDAFQRAETLRPGSVDRDEILQAMDRLAGTLRSRGNPEDMPESLALRANVVDEMVAIHGEFHPNTLTAVNNLGAVLVEMRDWEAADRLYTRARTIVEKIDGSLFDQFMIQANHADVYAGMKRYQTAEENYRECITYFVKESLAYETGNLATSLANLLVEQDRLDDAESWYRRALHERERFFGEDHPLTFSAMRKLARCMVRSQQYEAALEYLDEVLATHQDVVGPDAGVTFSVRQTYAQTLTGLNRIEDAEAFLEETHAVLRDGRGADHRYTLEAKRDLDEFRFQRK